MGNVGQAIAGYLSHLGYTIFLYNRSLERINDIVKDNNEIKLSGAVNCKGVISCLTDHMEEIIPNCDIVFVTVPADAHAEIAYRMAGLLHEKQCIVLVPGRTLGAYKFYKCLCECSVTKHVIISEVNTVFFACRLIKNGRVQIHSRKNSVKMSVLNEDPGNPLINQVCDMFPEIEMVDSTFNTGLSNVGMILHPAPFLFNLPRIEKGESFFYYRDGITPVVASFLEKLDEERIRVGEKLGIDVESIQDWLKRTYQANGSSLFSCLQHTGAYTEVMAPRKIYSRYIFEDITTGLVTLCQLGQIFGVELPYASAVINLAGLIYQENFFRYGPVILDSDIKTIRNMEKARS